MAAPTPNAKGQPEEPHAPAEGYTLMSDILGDDYFIRPQPHPNLSVNLLVVGGDGIPTCWRIHRVIASVVWMRLSKVPHRFAFVKWVPHDYNPFEAAA